VRVALKVAYDGTDFFGFARQRNQRTVQGTLEEKLSLVLRSPIELRGAGRTDRGVHADGQVVSFDLPSEETDPAWIADRLNKWLAPEVAVRAAASVPDSFNARFSARRRSYEYRCYAGAAPDPFLDRFNAWLPAAPQLAPMRSAARVLIGEHDFSSFCRRGEGSLIRRIRRLVISTPAPGRVVFRVEADSFCHQQVRAMVGTLLAVGSGDREPADVAALLAARSRAGAAEIAPAHGLTLVAVSYRPDPFRS
jgi:tRNA pseudouridine38-40 synthase